MPTLARTDREIYDFTKEELAAAATLTELNRQFITTQIGLKQLEKSARLVEFDAGPQSLQKFAMGHAYDSGFIDGMLWLLSVSEDQKQVLLDIAEAQRASQQNS